MQNIETVGAVASELDHEAPAIKRLGSLSELTLGFGDNTADVVGGNSGPNGDASFLP